MAVLEFIVPDEWDNKKLDTLLRSRFKLSGTTIKRARHTENGITMNDKHIRTVDSVAAGAVIKIMVDSVEREYKPSGQNVPLLYCDEDIAILDKPFGMTCHPSRGHPYDTLANSFASMPQMHGKIFRPIGRLDKDTSGAVVCALHAHAAFALGGENKPKKRYLAIAPPPAQESGTIDAPIAREHEDSVRRCVDSTGQSAVTHYKTLLTDKKLSLLGLVIETGRTHQIRVHMAHIGSPLLGDELYNGCCDELNRHALHCGQVSLLQPMSHEQITVFSPFPQDMAEILKRHFSKEQIKNALDNWQKGESL